ncbi:stage V sporulation protein B [Sulfoacidibacillus thermotolerans]|uniref:Stage V sporulation protein B n=1 Tax=Sulfoacidibacillus thermotolerans TaxID=1765684 RepID=A0A2U3DB72_SULT2|nr:stage V sporulation protein B [Sulfoacidibacillus thermotolerans]PWI58526.1 stage V sporulation protein B [Sulfoacidibacillus thermotolerans]
MQRQSFIAGTSVLIGASLITRILGFIYRIALTRLIGAEGIGLFQMVFPLLTLILTIVTFGMGVSVSKLVAESVVTGNRERIRRILVTALSITLTLAIVLTVGMILFGHFFARYLFTDPRAYFPFITLTPIILIIAAASVLRGYFQGLQIMSTPSVAAIIETLVRIVAVWIIAFLSLAKGKGMEYAAASVSGGMILGELAGCLYMYLIYRRKIRISNLPLPPYTGEPEPFTRTLRAMFEIALPVTFSRFIGSIAFAVEPILVTRSLLMAGITTTLATRMYGEYSGMAIPLLVFPTVFTYSLAVQLVPSISEAIAAGQEKLVERRLYQSFRVTALVGFPTSLILLQYATPLCDAIFHHPHVAPLLAIMAPTGFLLYLQGPLSGILQGINKAGIAMRNSLIGAAIKLLIIYFLASKPAIGISGVAIAVAASVTLTTLLHINSVHRIIGFYVDALDTAKILAATAAMGLFTHLLWINLSAVPLSTALTTAISSGLMVYLLLLVMSGTLTSHAFTRIPWIGKRLAHFIKYIPFSK